MQLTGAGGHCMRGLMILAAVCVAAGSITACARKSADSEAVVDGAAKAAGANASARVDDARIRNADREPGNWLSYGRTYDEQRGLWNPFRPADRDSIFRLAREQLARSAGEVELARHTEESARRLLEALVSVQGYRTDVTFADDSYAGGGARGREARE